MSGYKTVFFLVFCEILNSKHISQKANDNKNKCIMVKIIVSVYCIQVCIHIFSDLCGIKQQ